MDDINYPQSYVPRLNDTSILDFENSLVNVIYTTAPNQFIGILRIIGYLVITALDVIFTLKGVAVMIAILAYLFLYGLPAVFARIWNKFGTWYFEGRFNLPEIPPVTPVSAPLDVPVRPASALATAMGFILPDPETPTRRSSWPFRILSLPISPSHWTFKFSTFFPSAPPSTPVVTSTSTERSGRQPTFNTPPQSPKLIVDVDFTENSFPSSSHGRKTPPSAQTAPTRTSPRRAAAANKIPPSIDTASAKTSPLKKTSSKTSAPEAVPAKQSPPKTPQASSSLSSASFSSGSSIEIFAVADNTSVSTVSSAGDLTVPYSNETVISYGAETVVPYNIENEEEHVNWFLKSSELVALTIRNWLLAFGKLSVSAIWKHPGKVMLIVLAIASVYSFIDAVPNTANSGSVASIFDGLRPRNVLQPVKAYGSYILSYLRSLTTVILSYPLSLICVVLRITFNFFAFLAAVLLGTPKYLGLVIFNVFGYFAIVILGFTRSLATVIFNSSESFATAILGYPRSLATIISDYLGPLATWANAIFFGLLIRLVTLSSSWIVAVPAFLAVAGIAVFHQTLWTIGCGGLLVALAAVAAFVPLKFMPLLILTLAVSTLAYWGSTVCLNSAAVTALSLVAVALGSWATQSCIDLTKRICPHIAGLPFSILTWQPVFWGTLLWIGQYFNNITFPTCLKSLSFYGLARIGRWGSTTWFCVFMLLAVFKGLKIFVHAVSYYLWTRPVPAPINPTITPEDVTVIVPTVCCFGQEFIDCIDSILINQPARIIISVVGHEKKIQAIRVCEKIDPRIEVVSTPDANKRTQLLKAVQGVRTPITVYADDHVFWPPTFLRSALAPFEDPIVGLVGTSKRVWRNRNLPFWDSFFNYIACIYLERHNFECTATYNIDGGVFVISGRTVLLRTSALHSLEYRTEFQDEYFVGIGPMKVDDDNFNTRFMVRHGYKTVFHNDSSATIETTLVHGTGQITKFRDQLLRWSRTTWRSNLKSLLTDRACYQRTPWTTYAMFISSLVNFALLYDLALYWSLKWSGAGHMCAFCIVLALSKLIKPLPYLVREWQDWKLVPMGILFAYAHSFIKLYSLWTIRDVAWSGRSGIKATA